MMLELLIVLPIEKYNFIQKKTFKTNMTREYDGSTIKCSASNAYTVYFGSNGVNSTAKTIEVYCGLSDSQNFKINIFNE